MFDLVKTKVNKDGKDYTDFYLKWEFEGKEYKVRVKPVFAHEYKVMFSSAKEE